MGVQGLWKLVESIGRPVTLETLDGKVLAVDVSLWLHQAVKGMRDRQGNPVPHAHLLVLFNRLCKLLFYGVKPVLVFDGGVPYLKQRTLAARRQKQARAEGEVESAQDKLLINFLQSKALETITGVAASVPDSLRSSQQPDVFALPAMPTLNDSDDNGDDDKEEESTSMLTQLTRHGKTDFLLAGRPVDVHSDDFKALPAESQHEVLVEMQRALKENSWSHLDSMPQQASDFSQFQLQNLLQRSQLSGRLRSVRSDLARQSAGVVTSGIPGQSGMTSSLSLDGATVHASQLASDSSTHFVFIKHKLGLDKDKNLFGGDSNDAKHASDNNNDDEDDDDVECVASRRSGAASALSDRPGGTRGQATVNVLSDSDDETLRGSEAAAGRTQVSSAVDNAPPTLAATAAAGGGGGGFLLDSDGDGDAGGGGGGGFLLDSDGDGDVGGGGGGGGFLLDSDGDGDGGGGGGGGFLLDSNGDGDADGGNAQHQPVAMAQDNDRILVAIDDAPSSSNDVNMYTGTDNTGQRQDTSTSPSIAGRFSPADRSPSSQLLTAGRLSDAEQVGLDVPKLTSETPTQAPSGIQIVVPLSEPSAGDLGFSLFDESDFVPANTVDQNSMLRSAAVSDVSQSSAGQGNSSPVITGVNAPSALDLSLEDVVDDSTLVDSPPGEPCPPRDASAWQDSQLQMSSRDLQEQLAAQQTALQSHQQTQRRRISGLTSQMMTETQNLLNLFGVPFLVAPMEAEAQCAWLEDSGLVEGIITDDSDVWLFGAKTVYKNFFNQDRDPELYTGVTLKNRMGLSREDLIGVGMLCGSDYTVGVKGVGCVLAMEVLNDFRGGVLPGLGKFRTWWQEAVEKGPTVKEPSLHTRLRKLVVPTGFPDDRVYKAYTKPLVDLSTEAFDWGMPDLVALRQFASDVFGWATKRTDDILLPVIQRMNKKKADKQTAITQFLTSQPAPAGGASRGIKSKRVKRVVLRMLDREKNAEDDDDDDGNDQSTQALAKRKRPGDGPCLSSSGSDSESDGEATTATTTPAVATHLSCLPRGAAEQPAVARAPSGSTRGGRRSAAAATRAAGGKTKAPAAPSRKRARRT